MKISMRASQIAACSTALLTVVFLAGCGTASSGSGPGATSTATSTATGGQGAASTTPAATTPAASSPAATSPASTPAGGPVPSGFAATSVTFVSADEAFVLGTAPCSAKPCTSIVRTLNRGATWVGLPAPVVPLAARYDTTGSQAAVWGIRFANPAHGFVFGTGLWETTDGGEHWTAVAGPGGSITDLEVIDGQVLALTGSTLYRRPLAGGSWSVVAQATNQSEIATQAQVAAVLDGTKVIVTGNGGLSTTTEATPCTTMGVAEPSSVAVTGPDSLALLCAGGAAMGSVQKTVYVSDDLGAQWTKAGSPPNGGDPEGISAGTPGQIVVEAASGASELYYSANGGATWSTAWSAGDGGAGFNDLGFTTTSNGVVVRGPASSDGNSEGSPGQLLLTSNGGATWQTVTW